MSKPKAKPKTPPRLVGEWVSVKDACQYMDVCYGTLRSYIDQGKLVANQIVKGGKIRVSSASIRELMGQATIPQTEMPSGA